LRRRSHLLFPARYCHLTTSLNPFP
jgi:hypothetical protein